MTGRTTAVAPADATRPTAATPQHADAAPVMPLLPPGVTALPPSALLDYLRLSLDHQAVVTAIGPNVTAAHPADGDLQVTLHSLPHYLVFTCVVTDGTEYVISDSPSNLGARTVHPADLAALWVQHGAAGMLLLAGMDEYNDEVRPAVYAPTPLADRLTAAVAALA